MSVVIMKVMGGLASQLHKYAIGRLLADRHCCQLMLDLSWFDSPGAGDTSRDFLLNKYQTRYLVASKEDIYALKSSKFQLKLNGLSKRLLGSTSLFLKSSHYIKGLNEDDVLDCIPPIYIEGEWFGARFLKCNESKLRRDLRIRGKLSRQAVDLLDSIQNSTSVAVHVRRGDFVESASASAFHHVVDLEYYKKTIETMQSRLQNPKFFVFSDDRRWVRQHFKEITADLRIIAENTPVEDLHLISSCKYQIIANSGFSWFGAWLNNTAGKIMFAPEKWVKNKAMNIEILSDLSESGFEVFDDY